MAEPQATREAAAGAETAPAPMPRKKKKKATARDEELSGKEKYTAKLTKIRDASEQAFINQIQRANDQADYWDIYDCNLNDNQGYNGNAQAYISLAADAVDARQIRFTNQLFPKSGRYVEVVSQDGDQPYAAIALIEHYIDSLKLKTDIVAPLCRNGDIEGQYNLYVTWRERERFVVSRKFEKEGDQEIEVVTQESIWDEGPSVECIPDSDLAIFPATSNTIYEAIDNGGGVAITRRWSKARVEQLYDDGEITKDAKEKILAGLENAANGNQQKNMAKEHVSATGIKAKGTWYLAREVWHHLEVDGARRICRSYFGGDTHELLGTKLNPYWCDLVPVISCPVKKVSGAAKGSSLYKRVASLQYAANDFLNEALDSATYSMLPIVMTDPNSNPKTATMILDLAAVWEVDPKTTQFAAFPKLWENGFEIIGALKSQIQQSLAVNASMIPSSGKKRPTQADVANEQAVDILTTSDSVSIIEEGVLTPMVRLFVELDAQYRTEDLLVPMFGQMGKRAKMDRIPPLQLGNRLAFKWLGVEAARNAAQIQQQIAGVATIMKVPPQLYRNHRLDLTAYLEHMVENLLGPRLAPLTFISLKDELSIGQPEENKMLAAGIPVTVSPMDDDQQHIMDPEFQQLLQADQSGVARVHFQMHMQQMQMKAVQAQQQAGQQMMGQGGQSRAGAQPGQPRPGQQPPGALHQDRMPAAGAMPINATQ